MSSRYTLDFLPAAMAGLAALIYNWQAFFLRNVRRARSAVAWIGVATVAFLLFEIAHARVFPSHRGPTATTAPNAVEFPLSNQRFTNSLHGYEITEDDDQFQEIPCNGTYWVLTNGVVRPSVTLFVNDPECAILSLFSLSGAPLTKADLAPIRAKIGLEYLQVREINISSNKATMIFRGPKSTRYQKGLQICFLGFIRPEDLGRRDPTVGMTSISFVKTGALSAKTPPEEIGRGPALQAGGVSAKSRGAGGIL